MADPPRSLLQHRTRFVVPAVIALLILLAWSNRFVQDDAFISFRYAANLVNGHGLVWNIGERVEGYTNFLWVIFIALGIRTGVEPVWFSYVLGLLSFAGTLSLTFLLIQKILNSTEIALLGMVLLGTSHTFSSYATGGLETQLQTILLTAIVTLTVYRSADNNWPQRELLILSFLMSAALLTRLDSALVCGTAALFCVVSLAGRKENTAFLRDVALLLAPAALILGVWFFWKLSYYGAWLPNTFHLKVSSFSAFPTGFGYLHRFATSYLLYPVAIISLFAIRRFVKNATRQLWLIVSSATLWLCYVVFVGGDFMEFRFMVPVLPFLMAAYMWLIFFFIGNRVLRILLVLLFLYGSIRHALTFTYDSTYEIESTSMLEAHLFDPKEQWVNIGKVLGDAFEHDPDIRIAVTTAGAIPYYSNLTTLDMLGLNDTGVVHRGLILGTRPGHQRIAPLSYLLQRRVHIAVSHPTVVPRDAPTFVAPFLPRDPGVPVPNVPVIEIPIDGERKLIVWYLTKHPKVDAAIVKYGWKSYAVLPD